MTNPARDGWRARQRTGQRETCTPSSKRWRLEQQLAAPVDADELAPHRSVWAGPSCGHLQSMRLHHRGVPLALCEAAELLSAGDAPVAHLPQPSATAP